MNDIDFDKEPTPVGELSLKIVALPGDTNGSGDIFSGWLVSQMDLATAVAATPIAKGRVATVAIHNMAFMTPVHIGAAVSCYTDIVEVGRSSIHINVEVWIAHKVSGEPVKVTEGEFVVVALDNNGRSKTIPGHDNIG